MAKDGGAARGTTGDPVLKAIAGQPFLGTTLLFLLAGSIKLMAVSGWNVATALAILRTTDPSTLLTDTFLSLLPAVIAALMAGATWWWAESLREKGGGLTFTINPPVVALISLAVFGPFVLPYWAYLPFFLAGSALLGFLLGALTWPWCDRCKRPISVVALLVLFGGGGGTFAYNLEQLGASAFQRVLILGLISVGGALSLVGLYVSKKLTIAKQQKRVRDVVKALALLVAFAVVLLILVLGTSWLAPERVVLKADLDIGDRATVATSRAICGSFPRQECQTLTAYVLKIDSAESTILTQGERAVVTLPGDAIAAHEICVFPRDPGSQWVLFSLRPAQLASSTRDSSPYQFCPTT